MHPGILIKKSKKGKFTITTTKNRFKIGHMALLKIFKECFPEEILSWRNEI